MASEIIPNGYLEWLEALKGRIQAARSRAALAVNSELIRLYHQIGHDILQRQTQQGWGAKVIERVARDLKATFPDMKGFSTSNLKYMRYFAEHCPDVQFGQQPANQLPWFHIVTLLTRLEPAEREWYALQTVAQGWSRLTLEQHIQNRLHQRQGAAISNFALRLPTPDSALAQETLKDPYLFDFLGLADDAHEREIEYEISHKMLKRYLEATIASPAELDAMPFGDLIRTGNEQKLLRGTWPNWKRYREMRSKTSHTYDESIALQVVAVIPSFLAEAEYLLEQLQKRKAE